MPPRLDPSHEPDKPERILLTIQETATLLRVSQDTIRRMIAKGELARVRVGARRVCIARAEIDTYVAQHTQRGIAPQTSDKTRRAAR